MRHYHYPLLLRQMYLILYPTMQTSCQSTKVHKLVQQVQLLWKLRIQISLMQFP